MTERLADINTHISGIRQLGSVVNAMRGIAGARAQQARTQLVAVDSYAQIIAQSIGQVLNLAPVQSGGGQQMNRSAVVVFCAEQGFAGAFSEHVLDAVTYGPATEIFLIGTRGAAIAAERGITVHWTSAMPSYSAGVPRLAGQIAEALYARIAESKIARLNAVYSVWRPGQVMGVTLQPLFPLDLADFRLPPLGNLPLLHLAPETLLADLTAEYVHAQLCQAALHAFAAENEARVAAMASAHGHIDQQLSQLELMQRIIRQEEITAEIIELAAGETAARGARCV